MKNPVKLSPLRDALFACAFIGTTFVTLAIATWRKWPDLVVDFGAQLYVPWQISTGAMLYQDVNYLVGGPFSQNYHALLFKIFGVSFLTLIVSNLVVLALLMAAIFYCFRRCSDQLTAITACVSVLLVFAFAHYTTMGIYNYITPYSAEVVHGLLFSIVALALLSRWFETESPRLASAAGFCAGLTLLTKPDLFLALALMFTFAAALFWQVKGKGLVLARSLARMTLAGTVPTGLFFLWFLHAENLRSSVKSVFAAWIPLLTTSAANNAFYQWCLGLDKPLDHLEQIGLQSAGLIGVVAVCVAVSWKTIPWRPALLLTILAAIGGIRLSWDFNWFTCGYALPSLCLSMLILVVMRERKEGWEPPVVFITLWAVWSLAVLGKLGVYCRISHYGFALAMPAFVTGIYFLLWALPRSLARDGLVRPGLLRTLLWLMLLPGLVKLTKSSMKLYSEKDMPVGSGGDAILAFSPHYRPMDTEVADALRWVEANVPPQATLMALPQGAMINYLSRHTNPTGYVAWNPPEQAAFGQGRMTTALISHSPDYIIEMYVDYTEYGETYFGQKKSLGLEAQEWIDAHYRLAWLIGHDWVKDRGQFGIKILRKNLENGEAPSTKLQAPEKLQAPSSKRPPF